MGLCLCRTEMTLIRLPASPFAASKFCFAFFVTPKETFMANIQGMSAYDQGTCSQVLFKRNV